MRNLKIIVGMLHTETDTFSSVKTRMEDFEVVKGEQVLNKIAVTQLFREAGAEVVPTVYANALPGGTTEKETYLELRDNMVSLIPRDKKIDGIWLYLHGAMEVEGVGSAEADLVSEIRKIVGNNVPVAVALDLHANVADGLVKKANVICGYRTAPHVDQVDTQLRAGRLLLRCISEKLLPEPIIIRPPLLVTGDMVTTTVDPGRLLIRELETTETREGIFWASLFVGQPWVDASNAGASVVVCAEKDPSIALREAKRLAKLFWAVREKFHFEEEAAEPEQAVRTALSAKERPVFITDSGDDTTAGAAGDNAYLLNVLLAEGAEDTLVAGITDREVVFSCGRLKVGDKMEVVLGGKLDKEASESVKIEAELKAKSRISSSGPLLYGDAGAAVVLSTNGIDIIVTEKRVGVVSPEIIESSGVKIDDYKIIVVKLGYLFDALRKVSKRSILALTPGSANEAIERLKFQKVRRPIYPIDKDFDWEP
jgi:microcystin degradation protein MlrC